VREFKKYNQSRKGKKKPRNLYVVFDDLGRNPFLLSKVINNPIHDLINNALHWGPHLIFLMQRYTMGSTIMRDNADKIFLFRMSNAQALKNLHNDLCGDIPFDEFMRHCTEAWHERHDYLQIDKNGDECVFKPGREHINKHFL